VWALGIPHAATTGLARATVSVGVAVCGPAGWEDVLKRADAAVLVAKRAGRNMVYSDQAISTEPTQAPAGPPESQPQADKQPSIQILVVDDDPTNRAVCRGCLQRGGYQVREAADGYIALEEIQKSPPDVIIMDVMMPNMDGLECTRTLRADPDTRDIPIIIVSALSRTEDILAGLQAGADEYISKPIRASELMVRVQSMARLHRERADLLHSYEQRGRQMRLLTRLVEFCRAVGLCDQTEDVLQHTVATLSDVVECGRVSIMLPDEDEKSLRIVSATGMDKSLADTVVVPVGTTIAGRVFASGHPTVVNTRAEAAANSGDYQAPYFASVPLISAPLDAAGRVVGVLNATDKRGSLPFESRDLEYIELISKVAGTAVHDIRMREAREKASDSIMVALASLAECRDNDTGRHLERVTKFCLLLAEALQHTDEYRGQIDADFLYKLERSAPLHDIGKVGIPDSILLYPGRLNPEQMAVMRTHSTVGARTIESLISRAPGVCFLEMARDIAAHHHERFDGTGYPDGLAGKSIPLAARITAVVDVYDALTSRRVYKEACSHDKAVTIILEGSGTAFDPDIIEAFIQQEKTFADLARTLADAGEPEFRAQPQPALSPG
jgi:putative two-component system response regulator